MSLKGLNGLVNRITAWADRLQREHTVLGFPYAVVKKYGDDEGGRQAALITYYGFLSIFPLLLLGVAVLSRVLADHPDRAEGAAIHGRAVAGCLANVDDPVHRRPDRLAAVRNGCRVLRLSDAEPCRRGPVPPASQFLLTVSPGVRGAGDAAARSAGSRGAHGGGHRAARPARSGAGSRRARVGAGRLRGAAVWCQVAAGAGRADPGAVAGSRLGRGGGDGGAQRRGAAAGQAGGQGRSRLRQLRHRGGHVRPAVPSRSGARIRG